MAGVKRESAAYACVSLLTKIRNLAVLMPMSAQEGVDQALQRQDMRYEPLIQRGSHQGSHWFIRQAQARPLTGTSALEESGTPRLRRPAEPAECAVRY